MTHDDGATGYTILLSAEQAESLERIAMTRSTLDAQVAGTDIVLEAIDEHLARLERPAPSRAETPPSRPGVLFGFLFGGDQEEAFRRLSNGVAAMLDNAGKLLDDANLLVEARRFERASFLVATAQEEMGKVYMLLDMCRVDFARRQHVLRHLCRSFYSHVLKHLYLDLSANQYAGIRNLREVQHHFRISARKWWPSDPESGEPDMPHETYFLREANLYVDVDTYADIWAVPDNPALAMSFRDGFVPGPLATAREMLDRLRASPNPKLYKPQALRAFNEAMKGFTVTERTSMTELRAAYEQAGRKLELALGVPRSEFAASELHNWPMYWIRL